MSLDGLSQAAQAFKDVNAVASGGLSIYQALNPAKPAAQRTPGINLSSSLGSSLPSSSGGNPSSLTANLNTANYNAGSGSGGGGGGISGGGLKSDSGGLDPYNKLMEILKVYRG